MPDANDKGRAIENAISHIEKQFGKGAIMKLGEASQRMAVDAIPTGSIALDIALGVGGVPRGRVVEIADTLVRSGAVDVIVVDSVAALVPKAELEGEMGDSHVGLQARLMSQALRKLTGAINRSRTALIFTNQLREKVGVMFGNPETTPGGRALKFYASVRLDVRRIDSIKQGTEVVGSRVKVKVVKNKVAPPFRVAEFDIMYNEGISKEGGLLDLAVELGLVKKTGAFFSYGETRLGQGRENAREFLKRNAPIAQEIERLIRQQTLVDRRGLEAMPAANGRAGYEEVDLA